MSLIRFKFSSLFNNLVKKGKRSLANKLSWNTLQKLRSVRKIKRKFSFRKRYCRIFSIINHAMYNTRTQLRVRTKKVSGRLVPIPAPLRITSQRSISSRWLIQTALRRRGPGNFSTKLAAELYDASYNRGFSVRKRKDHDSLVKRSKENIRYLKNFVNREL